MKGLKIRLVNEKDLLSLVVLAGEFMPGEATAEERISVLEHALENPDYELMVAELDGEIFGFVDQWIIHDFCHGGKLSYIQNLYVAPRYRKKGIGSKLLRRIINTAKKKGVLEIHMVTGFDNKPAIELYKKHGLVKESLQFEMELK